MSRPTIAAQPLVATLTLALGLAACSGADEMGFYDGAPSSGVAYDTQDSQEATGERYAEATENVFIDTAEDHLATFSVDVDTASYDLARRDLEAGRLPDPASVRVEEYLNFFDYHYDTPKIGVDTAPFSTSIDLGPSLFGDDLQMLRVGMQGAVIADEDRLPTNLVFLVDTSGSMHQEISLIRYSLSVLTEALRPQDTVSIVTYAGYTSTALPVTPVAERGAIYEAIGGLSSGGGTNGHGGIVAAYDQAEVGFVEGGINRVVLCTDGDFNIGLVGQELVDLMVDYRDRGIYLSVLGFGYGNFNDAQLEELTNNGNGNYSYIADRNDAVHALADSVTSMMQVIAGDVKLQIDLNPEVVSRYRIVGYDNRVLQDWEFVDDTVDAAEIGAGQNVTALIEFELQEGVDTSDPALRVATVLTRFKYPGESESVELSREVAMGQMVTSVDELTDATRWALAVTEFAEILRDSQHSEGARFDEVLELASPLVGESTDRQAFVDLVSRAATLWQ